MYDLNQLRQTEFPFSSQYIYFNHASISPLPVRTKNKAQWVIENLSHISPTFWMDEAMPMMEKFGKDLATYINASSPQEIVAFASTSLALNAIAQAIEWQPGDNVLFCDIEFPSNVYPWMSLERDGVETRRVTAVNGGLTLAALEPLVDEQTRLVTASSIQFFTGHRTDLAAIGAFCRERDILFVVDAIQSIGHMKIDVEAMNIDVLASGGQKSILATPGLGFMYVRQEVAERMNPRIIGPNATEDYLHWLNYDLTLRPAAQRFGSGTPNLAGMFAIIESVALLNELGVENIDEHTRALTAAATHLLSDMGYEVITPTDDNGPIVTFRTALDNEETDALVAYLGQKNVSIVKRRDAAGNAHVRLSFHCYNTPEEVARFGEILGEWQRERES